ncbi:MAG: hypothetical protein ASARMPREDX12_005375 [Alectoria sarmentosa]|nr:MAG: hypothetical protein ASARMPREDX12_005375 [Alectoria sarmentosa]
MDTHTPRELLGCGKRQQLGYQWILLLGLRGPGSGIDPSDVLVEASTISEKEDRIVCTLGLGSINSISAAICGAIKASYLRSLTAKSDVTWISVSLLVWNVTEANVVIYAACLPAIWPLLQQSFEAMMSCKATASSRASGSGMWMGRDASRNQSIKLSNIRGRENNGTARDCNSAGIPDWGFRSRDSDSDKAHILLLRTLDGPDDLAVPLVSNGPMNQ